MIVSLLTSMRSRISTATALLCVFALLAPAWVAAQTNPAPQSLPYSQDFDPDPPHTGTGSTVYPAGWQGWLLNNGAPNGSYVVDGPDGDKSLQAGSSASTTGNGAHNYNGKIGFLNTGTQDNGMALAINTTGFSGVIVQYDIMTIRNHQEAPGDDRINEVSLQYRVGTSGTWTTLTGQEYRNDDGDANNKITSGDTSPQKLETKSVVLPPATDNQPEVQLRWAQRQVSGSGDRPSFALDNVLVGPAVVPSIAIGPVTENEGQSGKTLFGFPITVTNPNQSPIDVTYTTIDGTATLANSDYQPPASTVLTIPAKATSATIPIQVNGDLTAEPTETFQVKLLTATNATITNDTGLGTIVNDDVSPTVSIGDASEFEGQSGKTAFNFTVTVSNPTDQNVEVTYTTADGTARLDNQDYQQPTSTTVTIPAKLSTATITVMVNGDNKEEGDETFFVQLLGATGGATISGDNTGVGTIQNDDVSPTVSIGDASEFEGQSGKTAFDFTVTLSNPTANQVDVTFTTADGTARLDNQDYQQPTTTTVTFPPKVTTATITVMVNGDVKEEGDETFFVRLLGATGGATISSDDTGVGTITNDDVSPTVSIGDASELEGQSGKTAFNFTVTLSNPTENQVDVTFATADGTARLDNQDYQLPASTVVTIPPKATTTTITVMVNGDMTQEGDETFFVRLLGATGGATISTDDTGVGTIQNDDVSPTVSITPTFKQHDEGSTGGKTPFEFTVTLSNSTENAVDVSYMTVDGTATDGVGAMEDDDYQELNTIVTIPAKTTSATITVQVNHDTAFETDEHFFVRLLGDQPVR
jgi:hypothetical protein